MLGSTWLIVNAAASALALLAPQAAPAPPSTPDFSGRWLLVEPAEPGPRIAAQLTVTQAREQTKNGTTLVVTVKRTVGRGLQSDTYKVGFVAGRVRPDGTASRIAAAWDGSVLVLENGTYPTTVGSQGRSTEHTERWSLAADGRLVVDITDRQPKADPTTAHLVYRKGR